MKKQIELHGTDFQKKVWRALMTIPKGETRTYSEVARMIGKPKAVRAVASAIAKNTIPVLIPCHRVVPQSGGIGKYRWGAKKKAQLLASEGVTIK